jgi:hypothetical protein
VAFPRVCTILDTSVAQRKPELQNRHCGRCCLQKRVRSKCQIPVQQTVRMSAGGAISAAFGAHGRQFKARKLTTGHDAAGCFVLWASRNRYLTWKVFTLLIAGRVMVLGQEWLFRPATENLGQARRMTCEVSGLALGVGKLMEFGK